MTDAELEAVHQAFHRLEQRWQPPIPDRPEWHAYDPLPVGEFLPGFRVATAASRGRRFLDLGCGIGTKLALAHALGWQVAGVDNHQPYLDAAAELVPEAQLRHADIRELDTIDADVVFMYRPARGDDLQAELERHVVSLLPPGAVLFLPARRVAPLGLTLLRSDVGRVD